MRYFAYGSNLCMPRLKWRGADPTMPRLAYLEGHSLTFNKRSDDGSAKANIAVVRDASSIVWGVVFTISDHKMTGLRQAEGHPHHYSEQVVPVVMNDEAHDVTTYVACDNFILQDENVRPFRWYLAHIIQGAETFGLPQPYIEQLKRTPTLEDRDRDRHRRERAFWGTH